MDQNDPGGTPWGEPEAIHGEATEGNHGVISRRSLLNGVGAVGGAALASSLLTGTATAQTTTTPISVSRFSLAIDGYEIASFSELSGIVAEVEASEYWDTTQTGTLVQKLPGKMKPPTVVLKRGLTGGMELWAWHEAVRVGTLASARKNCTLTMFNSVAQPVVKYFLSNAWPSKIELGALKAGTSEVLYETVTLTVERIQRQSPR